MTPQQLFSILWRRMWIIVVTFVATLTGAAMVLAVLPSRYDATTTAMIDPGQIDPVTGQTTSATMIRLVQGNLIALVNSERVALDVVKRLNLANNPEMAASYAQSDAAGHSDISVWIATELLTHVDAKFGNADPTNVLTIKYKSTSPIQAALIANTFMSSFIDAALAMKVAAAQQTAQWLEPQTDKLRLDLEAARSKLTQYQSEAKLIAVNGGGSDAESSQLMAITAELTTAKNELLTVESSLAATAANDVAGIMEVQVSDSAVLQGLKTRLATTNADIGTIQNQVGDNNPKLTSLLASRKALQEQIRTEIKASRDLLTNRAKALKAQIAFLEKARSDRVDEMITIQAKRDRLATLQQEVQWRQDLLHHASSGAGTARLQSQLSFSNITPLDKATPPNSPAFPKPMLIMAAGTGAGFALGLIFALLAEALDRRIRVAGDLEFAVAAPVLGTMMRSSARRPLLSQYLRSVPSRGRSVASSATRAVAAGRKAIQNLSLVKLSTNNAASANTAAANMASAKAVSAATAAGRTAPAGTGSTKSASVKPASDTRTRRET